MLKATKDQRPSSLASRKRRDTALPNRGAAHGSKGKSKNPTRASIGRKSLAEDAEGDNTTFEKPDLFGLCEFFPRAQEAIG